jgi:UDP-N-acetyl-D-mannosaminuronic acid dehydrogenase
VVPTGEVLIAVPTPFQAEHQPDLRFVQAAAESIAPVLKPGAVGDINIGRFTVLRETQIGTRCGQPVSHLLGGANLLPGKVMVELINNDRVIGGMTPACSARASELYRLFYSQRRY